jgi:DDE domain
LIVHGAASLAISILAVFDWTIVELMGKNTSAGGFASGRSSRAARPGRQPPATSSAAAAQQLVLAPSFIRGYGLQLPLRPPFLTPCACAFDRSREDRKWRKAGRVKGRWKYLYRAIDKGGATLDCFLADRRNAEAAKRFLSAALKRSRTGSRG